MEFLLAEAIAILGGFVVAFFIGSAMGVALVAGVWATAFIISHIIVWGGFLILDGDMNIFD